MKTLKISLVILCLLHVRAVGLPQFSGAISFMTINLNSQKYGNKTVLFDDGDYHLVKLHRWHLHRSSGTFYCRARTNDKYIYMHRLILNCNKGKLCDHRNGDGLDNRRNNLRMCNKSQNAINSKIRSNNTTGFKGVHFHKGAGKFSASIKCGKSIHLGLFKTAKEAARAYNDAAQKYHGEFVCLNEID